jgi:hypothetical protein
MVEIKPNIVNGEPRCYFSCPSSLLNPPCLFLNLEGTCVPGLEQQRDYYKLMLDMAVAILIDNRPRFPACCPPLANERCYRDCCGKQPTDCWMKYIKESSDEK